MEVDLVRVDLEGRHLFDYLAGITKINAILLSV